MTTQSYILEKLVRKKRVPLLFIGSGISKRYVQRFPSWEDLLKECFWLLNSSEFFYPSINDPLKRRGLEDYDRLKILGTIAEEKYNEWYFKQALSSNKTAPKWISEGISPFKVYISNRFWEIRLKDSPNLIMERALLKDLTGKVGCVVTTNYDQFLEKHIFSENFDVFINQFELFNKNSVNVRELYKIHGCITQPNSIVITEYDYSNFSSNRKLTIAKMLNLFSEYPILFMGYSMNDQNIRGIILDFLSCLSEKQLENIQEHFIFIEYKRGQDELVETIETIQTPKGNIPITKIETDNFIKIFEILNQLNPTLSTGIIKKSKKILRSIIDENVTSEKPRAIIVTTDQIENVADQELAIALGTTESILGQIGYDRIDYNSLFEDVLNEVSIYNSYMLTTHTLANTPKNVLIPFHKYVQSITPEEANADWKLKFFLSRNSSFESIYPSKMRSTLKSVQPFENYDAFKSFIDSVDFETDKKFRYMSASIQRFSKKEIRDFCLLSLAINRDECLSSTYFKRCVMYYDLIAYSNKKYYPHVQDVPEPE